MPATGNWSRKIALICMGLARSILAHPHGYYPGFAAKFLETSQQNRFGKECGKDRENSGGEQKHYKAAGKWVINLLPSRIRAGLNNLCK